MAGRPKKDAVQNESIRIRILPEHKAVLQAAAQNRGASLSSWSKDRLLVAAREELGEEVAAEIERQAREDGA